MRINRLYNRQKKIGIHLRTLLFLSIALLFSMPGCDQNKILEPTPYGQKTSQNFWRNASDAESAINAAYAPLPEENLWGHVENVLANIPSDDEYRAGDHGNEQAIEDFTYDPTNSALDAGWADKYEIIQRANQILINVPDIDMDKSEKDRILGEAHFLRGFIYWNFAKLFGGVPLILEDDVKKGIFNKPRATLQETYDQVESDMLAAAKLLSLSYSDQADIGRANRGAAWGFLTKLYVYEERWQEAIDIGEKVINGPYALAASYDDNYKISTQYNPEILFTIGSQSGWNEQVRTIYTTPRPWGGWDFHEPLPDLVNEFDPNDPRKDYSIMMPGDVFDLGGDKGKTVFTSDLAPNTGYLYQKWAAWRSEGGLDLNMNIPILRSADVYLLVAEAKIRSGGNGDAEISAVRGRAGLPDVTNATMKDLIHERRVELAGEGQRHSDLMRWDRAGIVDIVEIYGEDRGSFDPPRDFKRPKNYLYAIPQRQIDLSDGVLKQNPGF